VMGLQLPNKLNLNQETQFYSTALRKVIHNLEQHAQTCTIKYTGTQMFLGETNC